MKYTNNKTKQKGQTMIIDFSHPNLVGTEWKVRVIKETPQGKLLPQNVRFENKDDAYKYYEMIHQLWLKQQERVK